jgi:NAD(P)-dependent dehydrogenase (short-subunit alcohol dehydrogenase family)
MSQTILITGGSRGIGAATSLLAAKKGYKVCVNYRRNREAAFNIVDTINQNGGNAIACQADVSVEAEVTGLFKEADKLGRLTALVNNSGILESQCRVDNMDAARLHRMFNVNVVSYFLCAKEAIKRMSTQHGGSGGAIVNVSSIASRTGAPNEYIDYAASKGAIDVFTVGLSKEVAGEGIRVNAVRPGFIYTEIHASGGEPDRVNRIKSTLPMQRGGQPEEVANAILWLLSEEASFTTGTFMELAGGR